jgi:hypothetical protein
VTFSGGSGLYTNLYRYQQGLLEIALDETDNLPGGSGALGLAAPALNEGDTLVVRAWQATAGGIVDGLWRVVNSSFEAIVKTGDLLPPGYSESFTLLGAPDLGSGTVAFVAGNVSSIGIYVDRAGVLERIVEFGATLPGSSDTFTSLNHVSADGDTVVFHASSALATGIGIYAWRDGQLMKVVVSGDVIDGKPVAQVYLGHNALSGNRVAFRVWFEDFSFAIYTATLAQPPVPVPGLSRSLAWVLALGLAIVGAIRLGSPRESCRGRQ